METVAVCSAGLTVIGFIAVWIKIGGRIGKQENRLDMVEKQQSKAEGEIASLKNETGSIQVEMARSMGVIETKLDYIKETLASLRGGRRAVETGGRRAAEK
jgi:peptidoglycan hydrolase CwlO-like protein